MALRGRKKSNKKPAIITVVVIVALFAGFLSAGAFLPNDKIAKNVFSGDINLGGLTIEEAKAELEGENPFEDKTIEVVSNGYKTEIIPQNIALEHDSNKTAEKAFLIGKSKNIFKNSCYFFRLIFGTIDIGYVPSVDRAALNDELYRFGATFNGEFSDFGVSIKENIVSITPRIEGQNPDTSKAEEEILESIEKGVFKNIPITLEKSEGSEIREDELYDILSAEPQEAEYVYDGNEISIKEHRVGVKLTKEKAKEAVSFLNSGRIAQIEAEIEYPKETAESLKEKLFNTTHASYSTTYSTAAQNRASNVALAASRINGKVLKPGEVFSYNETIGDTTIANGYKVAPVFENGKESTGVGGGICQVSSTLYSAVLYADLKVVERRNHSLTVAYVPKGQDATVSYGAIDFKFENDTGYPVKIVSNASGGKLTVSIVGTRRDVQRTVKISHSIVSSTEPTVVEKIDETMPPDSKKVTSGGKSGYVVDTYKTVYENGVQISSKKITRSAYKMLPTEMLVGPKTEAPVDAPVSPAPTENVVAEPTDLPTPEVTKEPQKAPTEEPETTVAPTKEPPVRPTAAPLE